MASRLSPEQQMRHDLVVQDYQIRFRRNLRGQRWAQRFMARRGWRW